MSLPSLPELIQTGARQRMLPTGEQGSVIALKDVASISAALAIPGWQVEAEALGMCVIPERYLRNMNAVSRLMQKRLLQSRIAQVGLGGLGGILLELFARSGIGRIWAADGDQFEESNLNRQLLSTPENLGTLKSEAARRHCENLNPSVEITTSNEFLTTATLPSFVASGEVVVDALGGLDTRAALQKAATQNNVPLVTGALAGWTGYASVVMPGESGPSDIMGIDNAAEETLGCPASSVTFFASLMATEAINIMTSGKSSLAGKMLVVDLKAMSFDLVTL